VRVKKNTKARPPEMQPIHLVDGVARFRKNAIVDWLFKTGKIDLNEILATAQMLEDAFPVEDVEQFWQMLGYSVSGYGDLSFVRKKTVEKADKIVEEMTG
jgi:hypothetical protein